MAKLNTLGGNSMLLMFVKIILLNAIPLAEGFLLAVLLREQHRYRLAEAGKTETIAVPPPSAAEESQDTEPFVPMEVPPLESVVQPSEETEQPQEPMNSDRQEPREAPNPEAPTKKSEPISETPPARKEPLDLGDLPSGFKIDHLMDGGLDENTSESEPEDFSFPMDESDAFQDGGMDDSFASEEDDILARAMLHDTEPTRQVDFETESEESVENKDGVSALAVELLGEGFDFDAVLNPRSQVEEEQPPTEEPEDDSALNVHGIEEGLQFRTVLDPLPDEVPTMEESDDTTLSSEEDQRPTADEPLMSAETIESLNPVLPELRLTELENDAYRIEPDFPVDSVVLRNTTSSCNIQATYPSDSIETYSVCSNPSSWNPDSVSVADTPPMLPRKSKRR